MTQNSVKAKTIRMNRLLLVIASLIVISAKTSTKKESVTLRHTNYTSVYSKDFHYPIVVEWWETKAKVGCAIKVARKNNFAPDPLLRSETNLRKDYAGSGFDRGHMCPSAVNLCQGPNVQDECFYYSNMAPQYAALNRGDWKSLETQTRTSAAKIDSIHIWCGNVGVAKKIGSTSVPTQCWKVIYSKKTKEWQAYLFNNTSAKSDGIANNKVDKIVIEKLTGLAFQ